ncbi:hypothetical protein C8A05DRAFT_34921, partial [Staphylotrichum tortipilum]
MVGVPGKYKGCETCRLRRVKCDNQRPHCKRCTDGGRTCAGYERETVFIIGTIQDQGRCSSHPPRPSKKAKSTAATPTPPPTTPSASTTYRGTEDEDGEGEGGIGVVEQGAVSAGVGGGGGPAAGIVLDGPARPAWEDLVAVRDRRGEGRYRLQLAGLRTELGGVGRAVAEAGDDEGAVFVSLPLYDRRPEVRPSAAQDDFRVEAQCLVHLAEQGGKGEGTDSVCLFLYEHNTSSYFSNLPFWKDPSAQTNPVRRLGPERFRTFPAHHFFARVYRPSAIMTALVNRTPTHLAEAHWLSTPFEAHPKSSFDHLLDTLALLPALLARADRVLTQQPTLTRRLMAQDLLHNTLDLEAALTRWHAAEGQQQHQTPTQIYTLASVYHWTTLTLLYPTLWRLYFAAVLDPVVMDTTTAPLSSPLITPHTPPAQINPLNPPILPSNSPHNLTTQASTHLP